jgi:CelD/BcsL family acetyltransferase involved in cellulose biosynthesis
MTDAAGLTAGARLRHVGRETLPYAVELTSDWNHVARDLFGASAQAHLTPFQHRHWLGAWYDGQTSDPTSAPVIAIVRDRRQNHVLAILPLVIRRWASLRIAEFAGGADYNAPIFGAAAAKQTIDPLTLWAAIRLALVNAPGGCDIVRFSKMPMAIDDLRNPLAYLPGTEACALAGHRLQPGDDYENHRHARERTFRKELERSWRVFTKNEGARFERITDSARALHVFTTLEAQQSARMQELGKDYTLDDESSSAFHHDLIHRGIDDGYVVLTALTCGETIVATLLGIRVGATYLMVRISNIGGTWSNCSPGRLIIEQSMMALHGDGVRSFDFSVGTYDYKRRFGVVDVPLRDLLAAVSWRGQAMLIIKRGVDSIRTGIAALRRRR